MNALQNRGPTPSNLFLPRALLFIAGMLTGAWGGMNAVPSPVVLPRWLGTLLWTFVIAVVAYWLWAEFENRPPRTPHVANPGRQRAADPEIPWRHMSHPVPVQSRRPRHEDLPRTPVQGMDKPSNERTEVLYLEEEPRRTRVAAPPRSPRPTDVPPLEPYGDGRIGWGPREEGELRGYMRGLADREPPSEADPKDK